MEFGFLGPLQVRDLHDREAEIKGTRRRGLLLRLLVDANSFVSVDRLSDDLWEGDPPPGAAQTIQSHVSNLRRALGKERVENQSRVGYRLRPRGAARKGPPPARAAGRPGPPRAPAP